VNPFLPSALQSDLVLASASPRRRDLLTGLGFEFECLPSGYAEESGPGADAAVLARANALGKASDVAMSRPGALVIGADTVVVSGGELLGKPADAEAAAAMLRRLSGREHKVITGLALARHAPACARLDSRAECGETVVRFRELSEQEIAAYVDSGEPFDKAGAYGIQGLASQFVSGIEGCYFNVMGLPLELLTRMLRRWEASS
jgi:septum formation protein